jgi:hypothetical protein
MSVDRKETCDTVEAPTSMLASVIKDRWMRSKIGGSVVARCGRGRDLRSVPSSPWQTVIRLTAAGLLSCAGCSSDGGTVQDFNAITREVRKAEQVCQIPRGKVQVERMDPKKQLPRVYVYAGCPPSPAYACLFEYREKRRISAYDLPLTISGCEGGMG